MKHSKIVLDTNVWLDWLIFDDKSINEIKKAQNLNQVTIFIDQLCQEEFERVLAYPRLKLSPQERQEYIQKIKKHSCCVDNQTSDLMHILPKCEDQDDQKFLELATHVGANCLVTRDKALLKLNIKLKKHGVKILTPYEWEVT